ncbi:Uncharacterised protein [uncultured archaeon]|nr:Uncharacterised protein [uncultured archaeon]
MKASNKDVDGRVFRCDRCYQHGDVADLLEQIVRYREYIDSLNSDPYSSGQRILAKDPWFGKRKK